MFGRRCYGGSVKIDAVVARWKVVAMVVVVMVNVCVFEFLGRTNNSVCLYVMVSSYSVCFCIVSKFTLKFKMFAKSTL